MFKKLTTVLAAMIIVFSFMTSTVFAYSNMYTETSGIPDYSEVTGALMISKTYKSTDSYQSTIYTYARTAYNDSNIFNYMNMLKDNGYMLFHTSGDYRTDIYTLINYNTGLMVMINIPEYYYAEYIGVAITIADLKFLN